MKKILFIDDDRIILETTSDFLKSEGYEIVKAHNGEEGIELAKNALPDLILCDIFMPKVDGYEVFTKLQSTPATCQIPFIFLTAKDGKEDIRFGMQLGVDDYITKPIDYNELIASIQARLDKFDKTIRISELRYRTLFEMANDAILLVKPSTGEIMDANVTCAEMLGYNKEELIHLFIKDIIEPNGSQSLVPLFDKTENWPEIPGTESLWRRKEGALIPVRISGKQLNLLNSALYLLIAHNISDLKSKESALLDSEERYRDIVNLTNDWIWEIDSNWSYTYVSSKVTVILGYTPEEMMGKTPFDFLPVESRNAFQNLLRTFVHEYKPISNLETWVQHRDGHMICLEMSAMPVFDKDGRYVGYRGAHRDITIRKSAEKQLIEAKEQAELSDKLKSSILSNISHELRTPLNGILGFSEILMTELHSTNYHQLVDNIHSSGLRLMTTLNSLILLSQLEAGKITVMEQESNIQDLINQIVRTLEHFASEKAITIVTSEIPDIYIRTDDYLLRSLLGQILDNAIKFTDHGSVNCFTTTHKDNEGEWFVIHIRDTGIGIDKKYYNLIFQEFRQVSEGFGRKYQGSGIGLTISKKIIDLLQGKITLESRLHHGSTFSIWLPQPGINRIETLHEVKKTKGPSPETKAQPKVSPRLLLVEDNVVNRDLIFYFLKDHYLVDAALDGTSAIQMAGNKQYDAILMDINLGTVISGIETTREIRKLKGYEKTPIIAVTGYTMFEDMDKLLAEDCSHYIAKPFNKATLMEFMAQALHSRK